MTKDILLEAVKNSKNYKISIFIEKFWTEALSMAKMGLTSVSYKIWNEKHVYLQNEDKNIITIKIEDILSFCENNQLKTRISDPTEYNIDKYIVISWEE